MMLENRPMEAGGVITRLFSIGSVLRNYFFTLFLLVIQQLPMTPFTDAMFWRDVIFLVVGNVSILIGWPSSSINFEKNL